MSSGVKVKSSISSHGLSLQMALLHLKWQQIRQMELESGLEDIPQHPQINSQNFSLSQQHEEIYSPA